MPLRMHRKVACWLICHQAKHTLLGPIYVCQTLCLTHLAAVCCCPSATHSDVSQGSLSLTPWHSVLWATSLVWASCWACAQLVPCEQPSLYIS